MYAFAFQICIYIYFYKRDTSKENLANAGLEPATSRIPTELMLVGQVRGQTISAEWPGNRALDMMQTT